jgi:hypothetical protein
MCIIPHPLFRRACLLSLEAVNVAIPWYRFFSRSLEAVHGTHGIQDGKMKVDVHQYHPEGIVR